VFPGGGSPSMTEMLQQAQQLQQRLVEAQEELARAQVQGSAGGGLVTATVSGAGELVGLEISPDALDPDDSDLATTLADLVLAAVRDATVRAGELQATTMGPLTEGLGGLAGPGAAGLGLPGA
jgi:DNA-binding YbaB/EbfC family protein